MCVHNINRTYDLLDRPTDLLPFSCVDNLCDYVDVNERILLQQTDLSILQLNIRGLLSKLDQLKSFLNDSFKDGMPDLLLLCETWVNTNSPKVHLKGYQLFEHRRLHKKGGGTCVLVKDQYNCKAYQNLNVEFETIEHCLVEITIEGKLYVAGSLYRAPNTSQKLFLTEYKKLIDCITEKKPYGIILGMDHNLDLLKSDKHFNTNDFLNINLENDLIPNNQQAY